MTDIVALQAQLANAEAERAAAVVRADDASERADGILLELQRARADAEALRKEAQDLRRDRDRAVEHDISVSRLLGRAEAVLDAAGSPATTRPEPGGPPVAVRNLQVYERVETLAAQLKATGGALDRVEEERADEALRAMLAEDRAKQLQDRCLRLEDYSMRLVDRMTPAWRRS